MGAIWLVRRRRKTISENLFAVDDVALRQARTSYLLGRYDLLVFFDLTLCDVYLKRTGVSGGGVIGITRSPTTATRVKITASNLFGESGESNQNIIWTATDLKNKSFSADMIRIRRGDSLLLTASGAGKKLTLAVVAQASSLQPNTDFSVVAQASSLQPNTDFSGAPGNRFAYRYDKAGTYVAQAWIDGVAVGSLTVIVIEVNMNKDIAAQVWFERINDVTKDMTISPSTFILQPSTFNLHPSTFILQPSSLNLHPSTLSISGSAQTGGWQWQAGICVARAAVVCCPCECGKESGPSGSR
ncbi:MAG: hypothetical protein V1899_02115 [Planctomycetota bacterium]